MGPGYHAHNSKYLLERKLLGREVMDKNETHFILNTFLRKYFST
jgi:hypothetical protein